MKNLGCGENFFPKLREFWKARDILQESNEVTAKWDDVLKALADDAHDELHFFVAERDEMGRVVVFD